MVLGSTSIEEALSSRGLAIRELPAFPGFSHRTFVLIESRHSTPTADVSDPELPLLSLSAAWSREQASMDFLEWWYQTTSAAGRFGVGATANEAIQRAKASGYEALISRALSTNLHPHVPGDGASVKQDELNDIDGRMVTTTYLDDFAYQTVVAELMLGRPPYYLVAVGCGPRAEERAILGVFTKFNAYPLRRKGSAMWIEVASECPRDTFPRNPVRISAATTRRELQIEVWSTEDELSVASATLPKDTSHPQGGGLAEPVDTIRLGVRAPTHLTLAHTDNEVALSRYFHENSKLHARNRPLPVINRKSISHSVHNTLAAAVRDYQFTSLQVALTPRSPEHPQSLARILSRRRSAAPFAEDPLDLQDLAYILLAAYGVTGQTKSSISTNQTDTEQVAIGLRATPSSGGLNSNDIFILVEDVVGIEPGLYYFSPELKSLQLVNSRARMSDLAEATGYAARVRSSSAVIFLAGAFNRVQWKYRERGYRMVLLDCGHLAQSLVIAATELDIVAHPIGGFLDDQVNTIIGLDGINDSVLHLLVLGKRKRSS